MHCPNLSSNKVEVAKQIKTNKETKMVMVWYHVIGWYWSICDAFRAPSVLSIICFDIPPSDSYIVLSVQFGK